LLQASEYLDAKYFTNYQGWKVGRRAQIRQWPRYNCFDNEGNSIPSDQIPREVINATYETAFIQVTEPGAFNVSYTPGKYKSARVEGAVSVEFAQFNSAYDIQRQFPAIDAILLPLLFSGSGAYSAFSGPMVRV
jgi:hypothetical protein